MKKASGATTLHPHIVAEASAWFIEFRAGDVQGRARQEFIEWLRRSPQHIQAYLEVSGTWANLPSSDPDGKIDIDSLILQARATADVVPLNALPISAPVLRRPWRRTSFAVAIAAGVCVVMLGLSAARYFSNLYSTETGEQRSVVLADGSTIELNSQSKLHVDLSNKVRNVTLLQGQALFHVAKDNRRPFIVRAGYAQVRAVGTQFDVYRKSNATVVTVVEGRVETTNYTSASGAGAIILSAGEQLTVQPHAASVPTQTDAAAATAWVQHQLSFEETPLSEVADQFNRYNRRPLRIEDPDLQSVRISGVYSSTDPTSLISFLRSQPSIDVIETADDVRIHHRETHHTHFPKENALPP